MSVIRWCVSFRDRVDGARVYARALCICIGTFTFVKL